MENLRVELQEKFNAIENKIAELEKVSSTEFKTNCQFRYNPSNSYSLLDISSTQNRSELIHANAFVTNKSEQYRKSADDLELNSYPVFRWCGYSAEDWSHDISLRFKILNLDGELQRLKELRNKIQPFLPEESKIKQLLLELS